MIDAVYIVHTLELFLRIRDICIEVDVRVVDLSSVGVDFTESAVDVDLVPFVPVIVVLFVDVASVALFVVLLKMYQLVCQKSLELGLEPYWSCSAVLSGDCWRYRLPLRLADR